jgi:hypothetical protein
MRNVHRIIGILLLATGLGGCMVSERPKGDSGSSGKRTHFFPALPHGQPFPRFGKNRKVLGLDRHGNARLEERITLVGTAFIIIPVAGQERDSYLFPRSSELCTASGEE